MARPLTYTPERIAADLEAWVAEHGQMPTKSQLLANGQGGLLNAIRKNGGLGAWAQRIGTDARRVGGQLTWDAARIERELKPIVAELGRFPTGTELRARGLDTLYAAIKHHGGADRWKQRMTA